MFIRDSREILFQIEEQEVHNILQHVSFSASQAKALEYNSLPSYEIQIVYVVPN